MEQEVGEKAGGTGLALALGFLAHGKRASRVWKPEELREVGDLPASPFAFDFQ